MKRTTERGFSSSYEKKEAQKISTVNRKIESGKVHSAKGVGQARKTRCRWKENAAHRGDGIDSAHAQRGSRSSPEGETATKGELFYFCIREREHGKE